MSMNRHCQQQGTGQHTIIMYSRPRLQKDSIFFLGVVVVHEFCSPIEPERTAGSESNSTAEASTLIEPSKKKRKQIRHVKLNDFLKAPADCLEGQSRENRDNQREEARKSKRVTRRDRMNIETREERRKKREQR